MVAGSAVKAIKPPQARVFFYDGAVVLYQGFMSAGAALEGLFVSGVVQIATRDVGIGRPEPAASAVAVDRLNTEKGRIAGSVRRSHPPRTTEVTGGVLGLLQVFVEQTSLTSLLVETANPAFYRKGRPLCGQP